MPRNIKNPKGPLTPDKNPWNRPEYRAKMTKICGDRLRAMRPWDTPEIKAKMLKTRGTPESREKYRQSMLKYHSEHPEMREKLAEGLRKWHKDHPDACRIHGLKCAEKFGLPTEVRILKRRILSFCKCVRNGDASFTPADVIAKFGPNPKCVFTGRPIDYKNPTTYHFDHIIPRSKGGANTIDNLQLTCPEANYAKSKMDDKTFITMCQEVAAYQDSLAART